MEQKREFEFKILSFVCSYLESLGCRVSKKYKDIAIDRANKGTLYHLRKVREKTCYMINR
ncbi:MAG: hypothetical protein A2W90_00085 [Bacteroidetes bacterium GWF2_42_66]|nr:MAG: hypothetical protein A2W92_09265 [Bacteroidetes bacterium GWA2_42_15]OFX97895.1 MAG: hypothetical protein A2W89_07500 [Bacteroidetes bacterium GWE2_42_39]OFY44128.1 MAG: hypothetical protein A2W90_00085 [Bacteroidetes bacterium GWF2_42_66]HBL74628.1 hypothetical protein [Prolixibacteraceae bacterium]